MTAAADIIRAKARTPVRMGLVLGSGLGAMADELEGATRFEFGDLPGFPVSGVSGHAGALTLGRLEGIEVAMLSGRKHYYEGGDAAAMRPVLECFKALGAELAFLTNAAGSTRKEIPPGALMAIRDHINFSGRDPLIGVEGDDRFVSMVNAYDDTLRLRLKWWAEEAELELFEGVYAWFSGPSFETPAEIAAIRKLGADAVGMSTAPECIIARHIGLPVVAVSVITNYAAGMTGAALSHDETKSEAAKAEDRFRALIRAFVGSYANG
ncbi:purine-nucleoside phosphorylase [Pikeienuella piscinae]|uniref:Purine nucleoside phosphorylase n=1 Tax=Pikeienuella piscinae TaxID=2748098 RepID=A0A7L5BYX9_9RHOB|nr:purine-nucleoside phosphorylase [Pikeienuella piscinae]QIE54809.1 purine-nucleoside phosphorylase [Pikeienuella piscinae]